MLRAFMLTALSQESLLAAHQLRTELVQQHERGFFDFKIRMSDRQEARQVLIQLALWYVIAKLSPTTTQVGRGFPLES